MSKKATVVCPSCKASLQLAVLDNKLQVIGHTGGVKPTGDDPPEPKPKEQDQDSLVKSWFLGTGERIDPQVEGDE